VMDWRLALGLALVFAPLVKPVRIAIRKWSRRPQAQVSKQTYEYRYVAFIDILGFARLVAQSERDEALAIKLVTILKGIAISSRNPAVAGIDRTMTAFSDSVVVSSLDSRAVLAAAVGLQRALLQVGALSRGGIAYGPLHHEGPVVLGPAMVRAYRIESQEAHTPRMVIDSAVMAQLPPGGRGRHFEQDQDGCWFMAPFYDWPLFEDRAQVQQVGSQLVDGFSEAASEGSSAVEKWRWMIQRFNAALARAHPDMEPIEIEP
jgi:hypothetical protein